MATNAKVRLNADLSPAVASALKDLAKSQNISLTEALSRAISTESVLAQRRSQGAKVVIDDGNGKLSELIFTR
ncbi:hypothetical protein ACFFTM_00810 [Pseudoduganella plicata]|jgi:putative aminopeptidase FrvX|uniref:Ribbon-helix-helix protein, CopG family n=1 Tax=Pseudoduganella plicata TaxID=321984 RepID=A0A4P7BD25_9BURK|nr:hypothetical protein [Pseudoduganella plicata]QBQ36571.1 hypothetical protein E1742_10660 [Pseudoduganella plicata]GGY74317.1 hypothetical protein GCM10007388_03370 [Pseudoduganella plicata]